MVQKTDSGLAIYADLKDLAGADVRVRRCHGNPARVVIESSDFREASTLDSGRVTPELDLKMAKEIAEALLTFCRRAAVHEDAGLPKKRFEPDPPKLEASPGYAGGAQPVESEKDRNDRQLLGAIHS